MLARRASAENTGNWRSTSGVRVKSSMMLMMMPGCQFVQANQLPVALVAG
jgi:hypothetical protein